MIEIFLKQHNGKVVTDLKVEDIPRALEQKPAMLWIDIGQSAPKKIESILNLFGIHPLTIEDCTIPNVRPKIEKFDEYLFLVLQAVNYQQKQRKVKLCELDLCVGKNFIITVHTDPIPSIQLNKDRIKKDPHHMDQGTDFLLYSIIDALVDNYFPVLSCLDKNLDQLEDQLSESATTETLDRFYDLKKDVGYLRRSLGPQRDIVSLLARGSYPSFIKQAHSHYFRDVYDHLVRMGDLVDTSRDAVSDILDVHASIAFNRFNETIKVLTIIATIMMPLTLITGIYGMNFKHMPEINSKFGYAGVWLVMLLVAFGMLMFIKRRKWM